MASKTKEGNTSRTGDTRPRRKTRARTSAPRPLRSGSAAGRWRSTQAGLVRFAASVFSLVLFAIVMAGVGVTGLGDFVEARATPHAASLMLIGAIGTGLGFVMFLGIGLWMTLTRGTRVGGAAAGGPILLVWSDPFSAGDLWRAARAGNLRKPPWPNRLARTLGLALLFLGLFLVCLSGAPRLAVTLLIAVPTWQGLVRLVLRRIYR